MLRRCGYRLSARSAEYPAAAYTVSHPIRAVRPSETRAKAGQTTGLMHLVTCVEGSVQLITLTKMMGGVEVMRGAVLTQIDRDGRYMPAFSSIVLTKLRDYDPLKHRTMVGSDRARAPTSLTSSARNSLIRNVAGLKSQSLSRSLRPLSLGLFFAAAPTRGDLHRPLPVKRPRLRSEWPRGGMLMGLQAERSKHKS